MVLIVGSFLGVAHSVAGRQKDPFAIALGPNQFAVGREFRVSGRRLRCTCGREAWAFLNRKNCDYGQERGKVDGSRHKQSPIENGMSAACLSFWLRYRAKQRRGRIVG